MSTALHSPSLLSAIRGWWRERLPRLGAAKTGGLFVKELWDFARDSTPERRRQRYGDVGFDWEHRVNTTSATVGWRDRLLGVFHSSYQPTDSTVFREMMNWLPMDYSRFTFIDLGSGKGRTLLMASEFPFQRVIGVELLPSLHRIAAENAQKFAAEELSHAPIETVCGDACAFEFPVAPLVLYLFNPLPQGGLERVLRNLGKSLLESPREIWLVYHNPVLEFVVASFEAFHKAGSSEQYVIYASAMALQGSSRAEAVSR